MATDEQKETNRNYEEIDRPYDSSLSRSVASTDNGNVEEQPVKSDGAMDDIWIRNFIRSENWHPKTVGFYLNGQTGYAEFTNVFVSGEIEAVLGNIGGFVIGPDYIRDEANNFGLSSATGESDNVRFWAGSPFDTRTTAEFRVYESGALFATDATITGTITGSAISGGTIDGTVITGGTIQTSATGKRLVMAGSPSNQYQFYDGATSVGYLKIDDDGAGGYYASIFIDGSGVETPAITVGTILGVAETTFFTAPFISASGRAAFGSILFGADFGGGDFQAGVSWSGGGDLAWTFLGGDALMRVDSEISPFIDNTYKLGSVTGSNKRWSDVRSVLINGADIGFENDWKFREYPAKREDVGKPVEWMRENANLGVQLLDNNENLIAVFHKNGNIYCNGVKPLSELGLLD